MNLEDRLDKPTTAWKPAPGDKIIGTVLELDTLESKFSGSYPLVVIETDDGEGNAIHAFHTVLRSELARKRPAIGDRLGIKYFGRDEDGGYEMYRVILDRKEPDARAAVDWDDVAAGAAHELASADVAPPSDLDATPAEEDAARL